MSEVDFLEIKNKIIENFPSKVRGNVENVLDRIEKSFEECKECNSQLIISPLMDIVRRFENGGLNPVRGLRVLEDHLKWVEVMADILKNKLYKNYSLELNDQVLMTLKTVYNQELWRGIRITPAGLVEKTYKELNNKENKKGNNVNNGEGTELNEEDSSNGAGEINDITESSIVQLVSELIAEVQDRILEVFPDDYPNLMDEKFNVIEKKIKSLSNDCEWAQKQIESGKANRVTIRNLLYEKKKQLIRDIELFKIFYPIYKKVTTFVELMPVFLLMLSEDVEGVEKIKEKCIGIFNEFSMGAAIDRITLSLKEKLNKSRDVEEIKINANGINKILNNLANALNMDVISSLRQMKIKTIINDDMIQRALDIGINLKGLDQRFGIASAPPSYNEIKIEAHKHFSAIISRIIKILNRRAKEEKDDLMITPNLRMLHKFILKIRDTIEDNFYIMPIHVAPLYAGLMLYLSKDLEKLLELLIPLEKEVLFKFLGDKEKTIEFYNKINEIFMDIGETYAEFRDIADLVLKLGRTDQKAALELIKQIGNEELHKNGYNSIIKNSKNNLRRLKLMNTLSEEDARKTEKELDELAINLKEFSRKWSAIELKRLVDEASSLISH
ncbi:MAG: hypothetical protein ACTSU2_15390 [Promethearchaeota archaeon]